ncbi:uncharacterized protein LOC131323784 [Rhododendron vialii]|uniref:uncharacterized protein LOC131323784 n=1 Tax=Rhododendron vialii TaxID=182163 RepID=UPI00265DF45C|nr:uncharacterized protein LOC131323784 [Rhododendron vialii]
MANSKLDKVKVSPFTDAILAEHPPARFTMPKINPYEAKEDAVLFITRFRQFMSLHNFSDAIMCKIFPLALTQPIMVWYNQLKPRSIKCFDELELEFTKRFVTSSIQPKTLSMLVNMRRKLAETLHMYTEQYWEVCNLIPDCNQAVAAKSFMNRLDPSSPMFRDLSRNPPRNMSELMTIIEKYCMHEEAVASMLNRRPSTPRSYSLITRLSRNRWLMSKAVCRVALSISLYRFHNRRNRDKLHNNNSGHKHVGSHGQTSILPRLQSLCGPFKRYLEELTAAGHLNQWIDTRHTPLPPLPPEGERTVGIIHGFVSPTEATELRAKIDKAIAERVVCSINASTKRKYKDPNDDWVLTFTKANFHGLRSPHTDALVVTVSIDRSTVQRVLIDQGSSAEVMFYSTYKSLGLEAYQLQPATSPLVSFTGTPVWPLGLITLSIRAGS